MLSFQAVIASGLLGAKQSFYYAGYRLLRRSRRETPRNDK